MSTRVVLSDKRLSLLFIPAAGAAAAGGAVGSLLVGAGAVSVGVGFGSVLGVPVVAVAGASGLVLSAGGGFFLRRKTAFCLAWTFCSESRDDLLALILSMASRAVGGFSVKEYCTTIIVLEGC